MVVTQWDYTPTQGVPVADNVVQSFIELDIMKKRVSTKKGIACRFTASFFFEEKAVLVYAGEDSYVIDLGDTIDKNELIKMIRNSFSKFTEKFELRKLNTVLHSNSIRTLMLYFPCCYTSLAAIAKEIFQIVTDYFISSSDLNLEAYTECINWYNRNCPRSFAVKSTSSFPVNASDLLDIVINCISVRGNLLSK